MILSPQGDHFILSLNGWREQGVQVVERATVRIVQTLVQPGAFFGLAFSPDGRTPTMMRMNLSTAISGMLRSGKASRCAIMASS
jgi:hypothetical protein